MHEGDDGTQAYMLAHSTFCVIRTCSHGDSCIKHEGDDGTQAYMLAHSTFCVIRTCSHGDSCIKLAAKCACASRGLLCSKLINCCPCKLPCLVPSPCCLQIHHNLLCKAVLYLLVGMYQCLNAFHLQRQLYKDQKKQPETYQLIS
jgi:hypothetical protein